MRCSQSSRSSRGKGGEATGETPVVPVGGALGERALPVCVPIDLVRCTLWPREC